MPLAPEPLGCRPVLQPGDRVWIADDRGTVVMLSIRGVFPLGGILETHSIEWWETPPLPPRSMSETRYYVAWDPPGAERRSVAWFEMSDFDRVEIRHDRVVLPPWPQ